jgi:hypothetical protein
VNFRVGVITMDDPDWVFNKLRFATEEEANGYRIALFTKWTALVDAKVFETTEPVNVQWDGKLIFLQNE